MMRPSIVKESYDFTHENIGLAEIAGTQNEPLIELAHHLCRVSAPKPLVDVDATIPWCSSWVNLALVVANIRRNPHDAFYMLQSKRFTNSVIRDCFEVAKVHFAMKEYETGVSIQEPTWSANSKSWDNWGDPVAPENARRGDLIRLSRDGGGHICFLDEDTLGTLALTVLGGNQSNMVCSSNYYSRTRLVSIRRSVF